MKSFKKSAVVAVAAAAIISAGLVAPVLAAPARPHVDAKSLDLAPADYSQYRRGWRGGRGYGRGAAIAGAVGLGILGAAAIASSRGAYARPYYGYDDGYAYGPRYGYAPAYAAPIYDDPIYEAPVVYQRRAYRPYGYYQPYDFRDNRDYRSNR